jgi:ornithine carbamoyltransferase
MRAVSSTLHRQLLSSAAIDAADAHALVESARAIKRSSASLPSRLRGKNIALLCTEPDCASARRFDAAASALGARVAHIEPASAWLHEDPPLGDQTARLLENLYDAVDCEALPADFARRLQAQLNVPVYDGLAREDHPIFGLLPSVAEGSHPPGDDDRHALLQAALVETLL